MAGDDPDAKMKGYLYMYSKTSGWKKLWIVLKSSVLYALGGPSDAVAVQDYAILGFHLQTDYILQVQTFHIYKIFLNTFN